MKNTSKQRTDRTALTQGIAYLSRREYSRKELGTKLAQCGFDRDEVEAALDRLAKEKWQDDRRFAQALVRMRASSGYGPARIRNELQTHRIGGEQADEAMSQYEGKWESIAIDWVRRRYGMVAEPGDPEGASGASAGTLADREAMLAVQRKAADFLTRRGFDYSCMKMAISALVRPAVA